MSKERRSVLFLYFYFGYTDDQIEEDFGRKKHDELPEMSSTKTAPERNEAGDKQSAFSLTLFYPCTEATLIQFVG